MPDTDAEEYWDCGPENPEDRAKLDAPDHVDWTDGELLRVWQDCEGDEKEFARRVKTARSTCGVRSIAFTGVNPDGETRECPVCMGEVEVDPVAGKVEHIGD